MTKEELIEQLADKEHASWANWMAYLYSKCETNPDGSLAIPSGLVARWQRQIDTPYAELSEREKQSDRDEVAHILPIIETYHPALDTNLVDSLFDQAKVMDTIAALANHVQRLETEVLSTGISNGERSRQTLLGRVNELSEASYLPHVDQSWFPF